MDPITALAVASAVVQFVKLGVEVSKKLAEYSQESQDVPKPLKSIQTRLPLLVNALASIQSESTLSGYDSEVRSILHGVVLGCLKLVREVDDIAAKIRPRLGENFASKLKKVLSTLKLDDRIEDIDLGLQGYISVLILHRLVDRTAVQALPTLEAEYFDVKEKIVANAIARDEFVSRLDKCFLGASRGQKQAPEYVILQGNEGVGKTQLALAYCHQARDAGQFQTLFWLDASTPSSLRLGLEAIALTVRRTKVGTTEQKLKFVDSFLTERWHPWLLVLDNYQHKEFHEHSITQFFPQKSNGAVLITTRDYDMPPFGTVIKVHRFMTEKEETDQRYKVTVALWSKDLDSIKDAFEQGLKADSYGHSAWGKDTEPLVNIAAEAGNNDALQFFLDEGANPEFDRAMHAVLASAVRSGSLATVALYLDHEDKAGKFLQDENYDWAFRVALEQGDVSILKEILHRREEKYRASSRKIGEGMVNAAEKGNIDVLRLLTSLNKFTFPEQTLATALCKAVDKRNLELVKFLVSEAHINPNALNDSDESALYHAAEIGRYESSEQQIRDDLVLLLLNAGASPDLGNRRGRSPLHRATGEGFISTASLLVEHGANVTAEDEDGISALMAAAKSKLPAMYALLTNVEIPEPDRHKKYFTRPLFLAARNGDRELALLLLKKGIIDEIEASSGDTAMLAAIRKDQVSLARMLIRNGAQQNIRGKDGKGALLLAAQHGLDLVARDLAKAKDTPGVEVSDEKGNTPLILAAQAGHEKTVKVLLELGADRDATNQYGETALDIVEEKDLEKVIKLLQGI